MDGSSIVMIKLVGKGNVNGFHALFFVGVISSLKFIIWHVILVAYEIQALLDFFNHITTLNNGECMT